MNNKGYKRDLQIAGLVFFIGFQVIIATAIGYFIGAFLDNKFNTNPWLMIICLGLGMTAGFIQVYRIGKRFFKD